MVNYLQERGWMALNNAQFTSKDNSKPEEGYALVIDHQCIHISASAEKGFYMKIINSTSTSRQGNIVLLPRN